MAASSHDPTVKWIEIISVRLASPVDVRLVRSLRASVRRTPNDSLRRVEFFYNPERDTDLALHLVHESPASALGDSRHLHRFADHLKHLGLVHRAIWVLYPEEIHEKE